MIHDLMVQHKNGIKPWPWEGKEQILFFLPFLFRKLFLLLHCSVLGYQMNGRYLPDVEYFGVLLEQIHSEKTFH